MANNNPAAATAAEETVNSVIETPVNAAEEAANIVGYLNIIKKLISTGAKRISSVRVKNINFTEKDNYTMISLTLASPIRGFVLDEATDTWKLGMTNTLYTSLYAIAGAIKEDENLAFMANKLLESPTAVNVVFNGATVDILQQEVKQGEEYFNPFTTKEHAEAQVYDHDVIINNVIKFNLSNTGQKAADRLMDKLLGF